jgi:hypothetical protein
MPIDCTGKGYLATDASVLVEAFEGALNELGLSDRNHPATLVVAKHIIALATAGVLDAVRLRDLTIEGIRIERQRSVALVWSVEEARASPRT